MNREKALNKCLDDILAAPNDKQRSLVAALIRINDFYNSGAYGFTPFKGSMLASARSSVNEDLVLAMNGMRFFTKHYFPDIVEGFTKVYRRQVLPKTDIKPGQVIKVTPRKPMLSWSTTRSIVVGGRKAPTSSQADYLLSVPSVKKGSVIWSYLSRDYADVIAKMLVKLLQERKEIKRKLKLTPKTSPKDRRELVAQLNGIIRRFDLLEWIKYAMSGPSLQEKEVTVYHGEESFTATVEKVIMKSKGK